MTTIDATWNTVIHAWDALSEALEGEHADNESVRDCAVALCQALEAHDDARAARTRRHFDGLMPSPIGNDLVVSVVQRTLALLQDQDENAIENAAAFLHHECQLLASSGFAEVDDTVVQDAIFGAIEKTVGVSTTQALAREYNRAMQRSNAAAWSRGE